MNEPSPGAAFRKALETHRPIAGIRKTLLNQLDQTGKAASQSSEESNLRTTE